VAVIELQLMIVGEWNIDPDEIANEKTAVAVKMLAWGRMI